MSDKQDGRTETLADLLMKEQARRGMTDRECAAEIGAKQQTYSAWKMGRKPRANTHQAIARFLRMKVNKLRMALADIPEPSTEMREIKLDAAGDSVLVTRRGGGALVISSSETGFEIDTAPRLK